MELFRLAEARWVRAGFHIGKSRPYISREPWPIHCSKAAVEVITGCLPCTCVLQITGKDLNQAPDWPMCECLNSVTSKKEAELPVSLLCLMTSNLDFASWSSFLPMTGVSQALTEATCIQALMWLWLSGHPWMPWLGVDRSLTWTWHLHSTPADFSLMFMATANRELRLCTNFISWYKTELISIQCHFNSE